MSGLGNWISMETESLKSGFSDISNNRSNSRQRGFPLGDLGLNGRNKQNNGSASNLSLSMSLPRNNHQHRNNQSNRSHTNHRSGRNSRREEPLLETPESGREQDGSEMMDQYSPQGQDGGRTLHREGHEVIEVQILPQDDGWRDNATAVTGNTSDRSNSPVGNNTNTSIKWAQLNQDEDHPASLGWCQRYLGSAISACVVVLAMLSPLGMILGHKIGFPSWRPPAISRECGTECHALLLTLAVKLVALFGAVWAIFWRAPSATMPRVYFFRAVTLLLAFLAAFTYWLFYWVRAEDDLSMLGATAFAGGLADALLAIHYLGVLLTEIHHISPKFHISVLRSPDGIERKFLIGSLSIQRAAVWVLQRYYSEFPSYNPHLDRLPPLRRRHGTSSVTNGNGSSFKFYDFDGMSSSFAPSIGRLSRRGISHNERFYEEHEFERRVRKRRARLIGATEEAFTHIKRLQDEQGTGVPLDCLEAAAAVFPSLARPLQKYLRVTRQLPWHTAESVLNHLAMALRLGLSPRAFLEKFLSSPAPIHTNREGKICSWALVSDISVSRTIALNTNFLLRNGEVSLFVTVSPLPHFNVTEQIVDPKNNKFTLRLSSETSV